LIEYETVALVIAVAGLITWQIQDIKGDVKEVKKDLKDLSKQNEEDHNKLWNFINKVKNY